MKHLRALVRLEKHLAEAILHVSDVRMALATEPRIKETQQFIDACAAKLAIISQGVAAVQQVASEKPEQGTLFDQPVYEEEPEPEPAEV